MLRVLFLLLLNVLLTTGDAPSPLVDALAGWGAETAVDCCPPGADDQDQGEDCCDDDYGMCCVLVAANLPAEQLATEEPPLTATPARRAPRAALLLPRANGPPHKRPPIA